MENSRIVQQLSLVFQDSPTCLAAAHMLCYEVGSQLQRHQLSWETERQRIATTIEKEMERSFHESPAKVQETTARHQQVMDAFLRDVDDRRRAVCRNARRLFLAWLKAASEDRISTKTATPAQQQQASSLINQAQMLPIDFGRRSTTTTKTEIKFPIFGSNSSEKIAIAVSFSSLNDLEMLLPLIQKHDSVDNRETALRAVGMLSRLVSTATSKNSSSSSNAILFFYGIDQSDFQSTCINPVRDFMFDLTDDDDNSSSTNETTTTCSREFAKNENNNCIHEIPLRGLFGANLAIALFAKNPKQQQGKDHQEQEQAHLKEKVQEVIDHCVTMRGATMISIAVSNSMSLAETTRFVIAVFDAIRLTSQDCCTSLRVSARNGIKIPQTTTSLSNNNNNNNNNSFTPFSSPLGASIRFFIPPHKLANVVSSVRKELLQ
jgi:hypothetical protein